MLGRSHSYGGMANGDFPTRDEIGDGPPIKNAANTNVIRHAGRILCLWEAGLPTEVDTSLETVGEYDFNGAYSGAGVTPTRVSRSIS